jgi:hypothetical protein
MRLKVLAATALATVLAIAPASATATYTSLLEYKDTGGTPTQSGPYGKVTLTEVNANTIDVTVTLFSPEIGFLNTGGPHDPFLFNLTGNYPVTVTNTSGQTFYNGGFDTAGTSSTNWVATPFGRFTNRIGCCNDKNGGANASPPPLTFSVYDSNGITFAGVNATFDPVTGRVVTLGTGDHFLSNSGGWWFTADLVDKNGATFNVAAKDAFGPTAPVPEPASWAMMIVGFGVVGGVMRRRRAAVTFA